MEELLEKTAAAPFLAEAETPHPGSWQGWITLSLMIPKLFSSVNGSGILNDSAWPLGLAAVDLWFNPGFKKRSEISIIWPSNLPVKNPKILHSHVLEWDSWVGAQLLPSALNLSKKKTFLDHFGGPFLESGQQISFLNVDPIPKHGQGLGFLAVLALGTALALRGCGRMLCLTSWGSRTHICVVQTWLMRNFLWITE